MQQVITARQARQITGGRQPLVPLEYEDACKALQACVTLDEAKYWSDKSDALAAWAKIYRDTRIERQAKILKLRAYRRMGELAVELRPPSYLPQRSRDGQMRAVRQAGSLALLREQGLSATQVRAAAALKNIPREKFEELTKKSNPPAPTTAANTRYYYASDAMNTLRGPTCMGFRSFCRGKAAAEFARSFSAGEERFAKEWATVIEEWIDEFLHHLP